MPSEKVLEAKKALVAELAERLKASVSGIVVNYEGISVTDDTKKKKELRECDVKYTVVKNTLLGRACEEAGLAGLEDVLEGTTAIATSETDYTGAARVLSKYAKDIDSFAIKSGFLDGEVIDMDKINALAKLPTREVLLANVLGAFQAPLHHSQEVSRLSLTRVALKLALLTKKMLTLKKLQQKKLQNNLSAKLT